MKRFHFMLLIAFGVAGCGVAEEDPEIVPVVSVQVAVASTMDLAVEVHAPATVFPRRQASVASRLTAPIRQLLSQKGDRVAADQILAQLEDRDLTAQRAEAAATLAEAESTLAKVSSGTLPAEIERARGQVRATRAGLDLAQSNYDRRSGLYEQGAIPERDFIASQTELAQAQALADVAETELRLLEEQSGTRDVEIAESRRDQARSRLELLDTQLEFAQIRSPFAGTITEQFQFTGDMAKPDAPIFTIADLSTAIARAQVPESDATAVQVGQSCSLTPADMSGANFDGRVSIVNSAIDTRQRTVEIWCEIPNTDVGLRAGVFGTVAVTTAIEPDAVVVPVSAVQFEEGSPNGIVMVAGPDRTAERRPVVTGATTDDVVAIVNGLTGGESVIVEGGFGLPDGARVDWGPDPQ